MAEHKSKNVYELRLKEIAIEYTIIADYLRSEFYRKFYEIESEINRLKLSTIRNQILDALNNDK